MKKFQVRVFSLVIGCAAALNVSAPQAAITWQFNYIDPGSSLGFYDTTYGTARRTALEDAATKWGAQFAHSGTISIDVNSEDNAGSSTLAYAGGYAVYPNPATSGFGNYQVIRNKILNGNDLNGAGVDGVIGVNWAHNWEISSNPADVDGTEMDFYSTMYHEFNHALGFGSAIAQDGSDPMGTVPGDNGMWDLFDKFITDVNGNPVIDPTTHILNEVLWNAESVGGASPTGGLFFSGANAMAANGGERIGLYTPAAWENGSSVSHPDDDNASYTGLLMLAYSGSGPGTRSLSPLEWGIMKDLGYTPVPLPSAILMFLPALAGIGALRARSRRAA